MIDFSFIEYYQAGRSQMVDWHVHENSFKAAGMNK